MQTLTNYQHKIFSDRFTLELQEDSGSVVILKFKATLRNKAKVMATFAIREASER